MRRIVMLKTPKRVLKIGGSLLDLPDLPRRVESWLARQPPAWNLLLVGGGEPVDRLRQEFIGTRHDEAALHWQCVDWMDQNATSLARLFPRFELCDQLASKEQMLRREGWIFQAGDWLRNTEPQLPGAKLRTNWEVSSDSIAARVAICWAADWLVLFKSREPPCDDLAQLAHLEYIDAMFPELAEDMPSHRFINLRNGAS